MRPPLPNERDAQFWAALADGQLMVPHCLDCGAHRFPPADACYRCHSTAWEWDRVAGSGTVATFCWLPDVVRSADGATVYYNVAVVTLDGTDGDPVRLVTNVVDAWDIGELEVGQRVQMQAVAVADGVHLPCFRRSRR